MGALIEARPKLFRRRIKAFFKDSPGNLAGVDEDEAELTELPMEILGPDQAQCILEIGPQGEICSNESFSCFASMIALAWRNIAPSTIALKTRGSASRPSSDSISFSVSR